MSRGGHRKAVASLVFGGVQLSVGPSQDLVGSFIALTLGRAYADRHLSTPKTGGREAVAGDFSKDPVEDCSCLGGLRLGHQDRKLVPAQAGREITLPESAAEDLGQLDQHAVADLMAQTVVDHFEIVDVDESYGVGGAQPRRQRAERCCKWSSKRRRLGRSVSGSVRAKYESRFRRAFISTLSRRNRSSTVA